MRRSFSPLSYLEASTPGTGGFIETATQRFQVRNVLDAIADPESLGKVPVDGTGARLRLADVSTIMIDHQPLIGDAIVNDGEGLVLVVEKFPGADTREVTEGVGDALDKLEPGLTGLQIDQSVFRPGNVISEALDNLALALLIAGLLLALVVAAFLFQWRAVLIALVTIPLSLVTAALVLDVFGGAFNAISFAGLAVAVALLVDDAVVGAESVGRRIRIDRESGVERSATAMVVEASQSVRRPLSYATVITLLAVAPLAAMQGRPGDFFSPLALAYAAAVLTAAVVAMTVTPALSVLLYARGDAGRREPPVAAHLGPRYARALAGFVRRPRMALVAAVGLGLVALVLLPMLDRKPVPSFEDRHVLVHLDAAAGTSNPRMTEITTAVSRDLGAISGVEDVGAHVGRAVGGDQLVDVNSSEVWVSIGADADYDATMASINDTVDAVDGVDHDVLTYTEQKIRDVGALEQGENAVVGEGLDVLTGVADPLVVRLYGQDLDTLREEAEKLLPTVTGVAGVANPQVVLPEMQPTLEIEVDLDRAREQGIKPGDVRRGETTLLQGLLVGSVFDEQKVFDVIVQGVPETRSSTGAVRNLLIEKPSGGYVRLGEVADVREAETPVVISRDAVSRHVDIIAGVEGRSLDAVAGELEDKLAEVSLPLEYHAQVLRQSTTDEIGATRMIGVAIAALILIFLLFQAAFQSWRLALIAFLSLPVALAGGALAALIDGAELSLGAMAGFLILFGLAARNGMLLIRHLQALERGGEPFGPELVHRGGTDRMLPVLTTAVALAVAAVPFVVMGTRSGLEIVSPMAVVMLGGIITSTFLALFVLPALYLRFAAGGTRIGPSEEDLMRRWSGLVPEGAVVIEEAAHETPKVEADHTEGDAGAHDPRV